MLPGSDSVDLRAGVSWRVLPCTDDSHKAGQDCLMQFLPDEAAMFKRALFRCCAFLIAAIAFSQKTEFSSIVKKYVAVGSKTIAITYVKVIDGMGMQ